MLETQPATTERFPDVASLLRPRREDAPACWCLSYRLPSAENNALHGTDRPGHLEQLCARDVAPGVVASYAVKSGAPMLEAYPVDPDAGRISGSLAYVGTASMFERAGFQRVVQTSARSGGLPRWLMRRDLSLEAGPR